ncbi:bifunctional DNA-formamidopyrimidine glycosylase/DNA-(apurinic or apyrimidinic site) lyase [Telmatobacter sp. DSM 110680]|uniref:Formamidopyrimidine-DNA glycosylase n=1 Tax=Telmatobacter sp. DSM 110680 TaxID=3036704 RepID=A0AAU7DM72_9BACT
MPELPEVETVARGVDARVRGDRVEEVWFGSHREPFKTPAFRQADGLRGRRIISVHRTGKHIVMELGDRKKGKAAASALAEPGEIHAQWIVHLGMTGRLLVTTPGAAIAKHTHARLTLESGRELRFVDPRRFGRLDFYDLGNAAGDAENRFIAKGLEPLSIGAEEFANLFRGRKLAIKAALLNQTLMAGVGNIYADESLFRAGIRPRRRAGKLTRLELEKLRGALREVLEHAIRLGGSSVSDYVDAEGVRGFFQLEHCVYQRTGEPCRICGESIKRIVVAGRSTHYCPHCQK